MRILKIDELKPGMKVAQDVSDSKGMLLFKAGVVLTADWITKLKDRVIPFVYIEDEGGSGGITEEDIKRKQEQIDSELDKVFADVKSSPIMSALCESAKAYLKKRVR